MKKHFLLLTTFGVGIIFIMTACASAPAGSPTPSVDMVSTLAFQQVYIIMTQTALAASPTPSITFTPAETPTLIETPLPTQLPKRPVVLEFADCRTGPGPQYTHITSIAPKKYVNIIGVGSIPGWLVIRDPYFRNICWIEIKYLKIDPRMNISAYPVMTPVNP